MSAQDIWLRKYHELWEYMKKTHKVHSALLCGSGWYISTAKSCHPDAIDVSYFSKLKCMDAGLV